MAATEFENPKALLDAVGTTFGPTDWVEISQERVNQFADATDDHQWIHVDAERAKSGPFGGTIAHGFLTMSMCARFSAELVRVRNVTMGINYGVNKARFITPVKVGGRIRASGELIEATEFPGGVQTVVRVTIELDGAGKPAAVIEAVSRYLS